MNNKDNHKVIDAEYDEINNTVENESNSNKESYFSLAPTDNVDNYELYEKIIDEVLMGHKYENGEFKNKNIAFTGIYGAGKSSLIKKYFDSKYKDKYIKVSLGKYYDNPNTSNNDYKIKIDLEKDNNNEAKVEKKINLESNYDIEQDIENSLLQQIIYYKRPNELPFSRIKRVDIDEKSNNTLANKAAIITSIFTIIVGLFIKYDNLEKIFDSFNYKKIFVLIVFILSFIIIISSLFYLLYLLLFFIFKKIKLFKSINKLIIKESSVELDENTDSIISKAMDELIYFFMKAKYEYVIFEDIDRLENPIKIFTKLKELNFILNNSVKDKTIRFIYEINDSIFDSSEHRTKFFDAIIPVISYTNSSASYKLLEERIREFNINNIRNRKDLIYISSYIDNARVINDIYNEYKMYYESNKQFIEKNDFINDNNVIESNKLMLFYLVCYKVLFPKRFDNLLNNKGALAYYFSKEFSESTIDKYVKNSLDDNKKELEEINNNRNLLISDFIRKINSIYGNSNNVSFYKTYDETKALFNIEELKTNYKYIELIRNDEIITKDIYNNVYTEERIFNIESKIDFFKKYDEFESKDKQLKIKRSKLNKLAFNDIDEDKLKEYRNGIKLDIGHKYYCSSSLDFNDLNDFEKFLLDNNYIDSTFSIFFAIQKGKLEDIKDDLVIRELIKGNGKPFDMVIYDCKRAIDDLYCNEFSKDCFCLEKLYEYLTSNNKTDYLTEIFDNLSEYKINNIIKLSDKFFINIVGYYDNIWEYIDKNKIDDEVTKNYIINTIKFASPDLFDKSLMIKKINTIDGIDDILELNFENIKDNLKCYDIDLQQKQFNSSNTKFLGYLYDNNLFNNNLNLFNAIIKSKKIPLIENKIIESYYNSNDDKTIKYIDNNKLLIINYLNNNQKDSDSSLKRFIKDLDESKVKLLLNKEDTIFNSFKSIDNKLFSIFDSLSNYKATITNLNTLYNYNKKNKIIPNISNNMKEMINVNYKKIIDNTRYNEKYHNLFFNLITKTDIKFNAFKYIVDKLLNTKENVYNFYELDIPKENYEYLINKGYLYTEDIENIIKMYSNDIYDKSFHKKYLDNSFKYIKDSFSDNMNLQILNDVLDLYDSSDAIKFVLKYSSLFDNKINSRIINILNTKRYDKISKEELCAVLIKDNNLKNINICIDNYFDILKEDKTFESILKERDNNFSHILQINDYKHRGHLSKKEYSLSLINKLLYYYEKYEVIEENNKFYFIRLKRIK